jgi:transposase
MSHAVGVDVSQGTLEVCAEPQGASRTFANTAAGIADLLAWLAPMTPTRVVFEASGGYEKALLHAVVAVGWPACRLNAQRVHHFARALGQRAKTDPVDAAVLQRFGDLIQPAGGVLPDADHAKLLALVKRRAQLVEMHTSETHRSRQAEVTTRASHQRMLRSLHREIVHIEHDIARCIDGSAPIAEQITLLASTPGIATVIASTLHASLPELGHYSRRAISALAGVAPMADDSGKHHGPRHIHGGRALPRTALYQATLSGLSWNACIKAHYARLKAAGKPSKVAMTACMRHLLCMLNAMVRDQKPWNPPPCRA